MHAAGATSRRDTQVLSTNTSRPLIRDDEAIQIGFFVRILEDDLVARILVGPGLKLHEPGGQPTDADGVGVVLRGH